jgi:type VI secretion system protein ImpE
MVRAEEILREGRLAEALEQLQSQVRDDPADAKLRVFLFQLLSVTAQWQRALTQLNVLRELDAASLPMVHAYGEALRCEVLREEIFAGRRSPLVFGDPEPWIARMVEALSRGAEGRHEEAARLREEALEAAEPSSGSIDARDFEWIADADPRLGPLLEVIVNGRYYWVPFRRIRRIRLEAPDDLRDLVWLPAQFTWANAGEAVGLIPSRYPGATSDADPEILLAHRTEWASPASDVYLGLGQRMLVTDRDEHPLLEAREVELANQDPGAEPSLG